MQYQTTEKDNYRKKNKKPKSTSFKSSSYKKQSTTYCWKAKYEKALFDITPT